MSAYSTSSGRNEPRADLAEDSKGTGIRVNALSPEATATEPAKEVNRPGF